MFNFVSTFIPNKPPPDFSPLQTILIQDETDRTLRKPTNLQNSERISSSFLTFVMVWCHMCTCLFFPRLLSLLSHLSTVNCLTQITRLNAIYRFDILVILVTGVHFGLPSNPRLHFIHTLTFP